MSEHINCPTCKCIVPNDVARITNGFCVYHRRINYEQPAWDQNAQDDREFESEESICGFAVGDQS